MPAKELTPAEFVRKAELLARNERWELELAQQIKVAKLLPPVRQFKFNEFRKWRADFAWPMVMLIAEVDGGIWTGGRHVTGNGFEKDCEKMNAAVIAGYKVLRFTPDMVKRGEALATLQCLLPVVGA